MEVTLFGSGFILRRYIPDQLVLTCLKSDVNELGWYGWVNKQGRGSEYIFTKVFPLNERGYNGLFITIVPKVYNSGFLFVGLTTLGTSMNLIG